MAEFIIALLVGGVLFLSYRIGYAAGWDRAMVRAAQIKQQHGDPQ